MISAADSGEQGGAPDAPAGFGDGRLPLEYYGEARLMSVAARRGLVPPDLRELPFRVSE